MNDLKKTIILLLGILVLTGCSDDDSENNVSNGFIVNGQFYETNHSAIECQYVGSQGSSVRTEIEFFSNFDFDYYCGFFLYPNVDNDNSQLTIGTYNTSTNNSFSSSSFISQSVSENIIQFRDNINFNRLFYSENTNNNGTVVINSITNVLDENNCYKTTKIDIDYRFTNPDGDEVVGNYNGLVEFREHTEVPD